jgi:hypothetical protein
VSLPPTVIDIAVTSHAQIAGYVLLRYLAEQLSGTDLRGGDTTPGNGSSPARGSVSADEAHGVVPNHVPQLVATDARFLQTAEVVSESLDWGHVGHLSEIARQDNGLLPDGPDLVPHLLNGPGVRTGGRQGKERLLDERSKPRRRPFRGAGIPCFEGNVFSWHSYYKNVRLTDKENALLRGCRDCPRESTFGVGTAESPDRIDTLSVPMVPSAA